MSKLQVKESEKMTEDIELTRKQKLRAWWTIFLWVWKEDYKEHWLYRKDKLKVLLGVVVSLVIFTVGYMLLPHLMNFA